MNLREQYNREGYCIYRGGCAGIIGWDNQKTKKAMVDVFNESIEKYIGRVSMEARRSDTQRLLLKIADSMFFEDERLVVSGLPSLHVMSPDLIIPGGYNGTAPHQDWPSVQGSLDMVTVWVALTDAGIGNFPLEVIPGSHKAGLLDGEFNGSVLEVAVDESDFVPLECKAGDVVFMSGFLVHRTGAGSPGAFRVALSQRFDNADEPTYIERGYYNAQKRVVDREIKWKPTDEQVRKIFE